MSLPSSPCHLRAAKEPQIEKQSLSTPPWPDKQEARESKINQKTNKYRRQVLDETCERQNDYPWVSELARFTNLDDQPIAKSSRKTDKDNLSKDFDDSVRSRQDEKVERPRAREQKRFLKRVSPELDQNMVKSSELNVLVAPEQEEEFSQCMFLDNINLYGLILFFELIVS